jgi:hypothetical protein
VILEYQRRYPDIIRTKFSPTNIGTLDPPQQKVTESGFRALTGDYVAILEGDDYWSSPHKIQKQVSFLEANPGYTTCAHNTVKVYEGGTQEAHRFFYEAGLKPTHTVDDVAEMRSFFHVSSLMWRNVTLSNPPAGWRSRWSIEIFNNLTHVRHGNLRYFDDDMSVYRAHPGGSYSNIGLRYLKAFAFSINRLALTLLKEVGEGVLPDLTLNQHLRYRAVAALSGLTYDLLDRFPRLDPAVFWYREPPKASNPRKGRLTGYGLAKD